jgi:hypothetical protein
LLGAVGCAKCGKAHGPPTSGVERVLPKGATAYLLVPSVEKLGERLRQLEGLKVVNFAAQANAFDSAHAYVDALVQDLGIDLRSKEQLERIGVASGSGAGVAIFDDDGTSLVVLPIKDEGRIGSFIRTFSANRLGASALEDVVENGVIIHRLMAGNGPRLAWAASSGYALIAPQKAVAKLAAWAARGEAETLASDPSLPESLGRLPHQRDAVVYVPPGTKSLLGLPFTHVVMVASLTAQAFTLSADAPWGGDTASLKVFEPKKQAASLLGLLPVDAFLVARFSGDAAQLGPLLLPLLGSNLQRAFSEGGFDVDAALKDVAPGTVLGLSLAPTAQMGAGMPELDVRRTNPFSFVHLSGVAPARSADAVGTWLGKLADVAPRFGAQMALKDGVYVTTYAQGEGVHFAAKGDRVLFGSPLPRLQALLSSDGGVGPASAFQDTLETSPIATVVDLHRLSDSVRELPSSAWGIGGFAIKATTLRWLDNSDDLRAVTITAGTKGGAVQGQIELLLGGSPGPSGDAGQ